MVISYRVRDKRRFPSKIANFPSPGRVFFAPADRVPLELGIGARFQEIKVTVYRAKREDVFSRVDRIHQRDRWMDGHRKSVKTTLTHIVARVEIKWLNMFLGRCIC